LGTNFFHSAVGVRRRGSQTQVIAMSKLGTNCFRALGGTSGFGLPGGAGEASEELVL